MRSFEVQSNESTCRKSGRIGLEQVWYPYNKLQTVQKYHVSYHDRLFFFLNFPWYMDVVHFTLLGNFPTIFPFRGSSLVPKILSDIEVSSAVTSQFPQRFPCTIFYVFLYDGFLVITWVSRTGLKSLNSPRYYPYWLSSTVFTRSTALCLVSW